MGDLNFPLISVIICTHNRQELLLRAITSVLNQSYTNLEIIIIDDFSTDDTEDVVNNLNSPKISYFKNQQNLGVAKSSNIGFSKSSGQYIALLGDDDYWFDSNKLSDDLSEFFKVKELGIVSSWWKEVNGTQYKYKKPTQPKNLRLKVLSGGSLFGGSSSLISRRAWLDVNGFDGNIKKGTDSNLFRRIILFGYLGLIRYKVTTIVDVDSNRTRMTNIKDINSIHRSIESYNHNLESLSVWYEMYPKAKSIYLYNIGKLYRLLQRYDNKEEYIFESNNYLYQSFITWPYHINALKVLIILILNFNNRVRSHLKKDRK